jgi:hypothetical protein
VNRGIVAAGIDVALGPAGEDIGDLGVAVEQERRALEDRRGARVVRDGRDQVEAKAGPAENIAGTNHLHIIGERAFHDWFKARLDAAFTVD